MTSRTPDALAAKTSSPLTIDDAIRSADLPAVAALRKELDKPNAELDRHYEHLRAQTLDLMKSHPCRFSRGALLQLVDNGIFTVNELLELGVITQKSWEKVKLQRDYLPDMTDFQKGNQEMQVPQEGTDVYFFGMPTSGKTSLLMGLTAANGLGYTLDMRTNGGPYAAALRQYAHAGIMPGRTLGRFVTSVSGTINRYKKSGRVKNLPINIVEMSGEEFALRIAETKEPSMANMGTGVTNLLRNGNQKVFFIIVDASRPMVKVSYLDHEIDDDGEIARAVKFRYISQLDILDKFMVLISLPENQDIMSHVDAIHFIVTKSDAIEGGEGETIEERALNLVNTQYLSVVEQLKNYCRRTRRINRTTDYTPLVFTYSLGKFYAGDVFEYDNTDTLKIVEAIRDSSVGVFRNFWQRLRDTFRPM